MNPELLAQLDATITMLSEGAILQAKHPTGGGIRQKFRTRLGKYFRSLEIPLYKLTQVYYGHVEFVVEASTPASGLPGFEDALEIAGEPIRRGTVLLHQMLLGGLYDGYLQGSNEAFKVLRVLDRMRPGDLRAARWAVEHGSKLVQGINETTRTALAKTIGRGIADKIGIPALEREIRQKVLDMSRFRSEMIARTETNMALSTAHFDRYKERNIKFKRISVFQPCPICTNNRAQGTIPMDDNFRSGHHHPPFHPSCRCTLVPVAASPIRKPRPT